MELLALTFVGASGFFYARQFAVKLRLNLVFDFDMNLTEQYTDFVLNYERERQVNIMDSGDGRGRSTSRDGRVCNQGVSVSDPLCEPEDFFSDC